MGLQTLITLLTCLCSVASATANPFKAVTGNNPEFPPQVNDTSNQYDPFVLSVSSDESDPNILRTLQIRPDPTTEGAFLVVVDASSPVLALSMRNNILYSQTRNRPTDKGPVGALRNSTTLNTSKFRDVREFVFRNLSIASPSFKESYDKWTLDGGISDSSYVLRNSVGNYLEYEFMTCKRGTTTDIYYQILYVGYEPGPYTSIPDCTPIVNLQALLEPGIDQVCNQYCEA